MNRELSVVVPEVLPPFVNYLNVSDAYEAEVGYGPGIVWQILKQLALKMNVTYVVRKVGNSQATRWSDAFDEVQHGEAELVVGAAVLQANQNPNISFSHPFLFEETGVLYHHSVDHLYHRNGSKFTVLGIEIVVLFIITLLVGVLFLMYAKVHYRAQYCSSANRTWLGSVLTLHSLMCGHGVDFKGNHPAFRWFAFTFYSLALLSYGIALSACFFYPSITGYSRNVFQTLDDVVEAVKTGEYTVVLHEKSARTEMIQSSVFHQIKQLWETVSSKDLVVYTNTIEEGIDLVRKNANFLLIGPFDTLDIVAKMDCKLRMMPYGILPAFQAIAVKDKSDYLDQLNEMQVDAHNKDLVYSIIRLREHGFIDKWVTGYGHFVTGITKVNRKDCRSERILVLPLRLSLLRHVFCVLFVGLALSSAAFVGEQCGRGLLRRFRRT